MRKSLERGNPCIEHPERMIEDERIRQKLADILYEYWYVLNGQDNQDAVIECVRDLWYLYFSGETYDDIQDAGEVSIREKIIEGLLHWFETYAPYRLQIDQLNRSARSHPDLALRLMVSLEALIRRTLVMSGDPALGLKGMVRVKGVAGVFLATAHIWMKDDSNDLAATMKMLDQRMSQAEEWGISLRVFDGGRSHNG